MVFFTRKLYEGSQDASGWELRARREWLKRQKIYHRYQVVITPLLPPAVVRLARETLHDAIVESAEQCGDTLALTMDARRAAGGFTGTRIRLEFSGVRERIPVQALGANCWLYEEAHLRSQGRFALLVMFDRSEIEIEADDLRIRRLPRQAA